MDEEIQTVTHDKLKPYHALTSIADALPAIGIIAAVLGVVHAMARSTSRPKFSAASSARRWSAPSPASSSPMASIAPLAHKVKATRATRCRLYIIVKQTLLAFMNGAMPQIALEHGRKTISSQRPAVDRHGRKRDGFGRLERPVQQQAA